jgi:hypothetical protein
VTGSYLCLWHLRYDVVLAGSQWLHDLLASRGVPREKLGVFWQCVDGQTFHPPSPPVTVDPQRFNIFSGEHWWPEFLT